MKEETGAFILFYNPPWPQPLCSPGPFTLLTPIQLSSALVFFPLPPSMDRSLPHPWIFDFKISLNSNNYIIVCRCLLIVFCPPFQFLWPTPLVDFSPHSWIFFQSMDNGIHQWPQPSGMDGVPGPSMECAPHPWIGIIGPRATETRFFTLSLVIICMYEYIFWEGILITRAVGFGSTKTIKRIYCQYWVVCTCTHTPVAELPVTLLLFLN